MNKLIYHILALIVMMLGVCSCKHTYTPKPNAFIRINLPEKNFRKFDSLAYPFTFNYPVYADFIPVKGIKWADINFKSLNAQINLSYIKNPNLDSCLTNIFFFIERHMGITSGIDEREIYIPEKKLYGYVYELKGKNVASQCQFYITDSSKHFVRGALYFNTAPNNDSLAPAIQFVKEDIDSIIYSWEWR